MPRLFTGLEIPEKLRDTLTALRGGLPGARWIEPEDYHVTLSFVGDIDDDDARELALALNQVRRPPLSLRLEGLDAFGGRKPRAVVALVAANPALMELQAEQERLIQRLGLPAENRKFTPHVTVARLRQADPRDVADYLAGRVLLRTEPAEIPRFVLFSSRQSVGGGPYLVEVAYPFRTPEPR